MVLYHPKSECTTTGQGKASEKKPFIHSANENIHPANENILRVGTMINEEPSSFGLKKTVFLLIIGKFTNIP